jgi:ribokinase
MILVFGSINVDIVVPVGHLPHPGETVIGGDYAVLPGGKGANQALAARRAGAAVTLAGAVGQDAFAEVALGSLVEAGVEIGLVRRVGAPTGLAAIMVQAGGENLIACASGANAAVRADHVPEERLGPAALVVAQMEIPVAETAALFARVRARGGRCLLNYAPALPIDRALLRDIDILVANKGEAASLGRDPAETARDLRQALVVTLGAAGAVAYWPKGGKLSVPALAVEPVDTTGAGDAFVGVLAATLDAGSSLDQALRRASAAGSLACLARGAQSALPDAAAIDRATALLPPR